MAALGAIAVVQPGFLHHMGRLVENFPLEQEIWLPFGEMARAGLRLAGSSDDPCAFHEPLRTSTYGATRRTGSGGVLGAEQALGYEDWLRAYTAGAAYAGGQEEERGSITAGKARRPGRGRGGPGCRASAARRPDVGGRRARVHGALEA